MRNSGQKNSDIEMYTEKTLSFIRETQDGKFTPSVPEFVQISYQRLQIAEPNGYCLQDDFDENHILLGTSY